MSMHDTDNASLTQQLRTAHRKIAELESRLHELEQGRLPPRPLTSEIRQKETANCAGLGEGLAQKERLYRTLVETAKDIIWTVDLELRYTYVSPSVTGVFGYAVDEIMTMFPLDLLTPESRERIIRAYHEELAVEASGPREKYTSRTEEVECYHKDGFTIWIQMTMTFLRDDAGKPVGILGISRDIKQSKRMKEELAKSYAELEQLVNERTADLAGANDSLKAEIAERRQAEEALRLSEEKFRTLVENINDVIFSLNTEGCFTYISPAIERLSGHGVNEVTGQPFVRFVHPDDVAALQDSLERTLTGTIEPYEFRVFAKDGAVLTVCTFSRPLWENGRLLGLTGIMTDVTKRRQAEADRWESEAHLRALMTAIPEPLIVYDSHGNVTFVNDAFVETYGWTQEEILGKPLDFVPAEELEGTLEAWQRAMRQERFLFDTRRFTKERGLLDIELSTATWFDREGRHRASLVIHRDVTERKRAEEDLRKAHAELEAFSYSVSHDLRSPLRGIDGWSLALLEDCADRLDDRGRSYLEIVRSETQRMGKLIDDLLDLSRVSRADMRRELVDLSALVRSIAERLKATEPDRRVEFVIQGEATAYGDARLLEIMLSNLLGNAWKFTGKHPSARIEFGWSRSEGRKTYFVRDDGAGFDMAYAKKLFGAFRRMHKTADFPGAGVGLATVQRIVHRHGGRVWAVAEVEKGATFYFTV